MVQVFCNCRATTKSVLRLIRVGGATTGPRKLIIDILYIVVKVLAGIETIVSGLLVNRFV